MIEKVFYVLIFICILIFVYIIYKIIKNRNHYTFKNIWHRMTEERESNSLSSLPFKLLGLKVPNITSRKFDAIFILSICFLVSLGIIISITLLILEKINFL